MFMTITAKRTLRVGVDWKEDMGAPYLVTFLALGRAYLTLIKFVSDIRN
jgi:hypothetical protein